MKRQKVTCSTLAELKSRFEEISINKQRKYIGGGDGTYSNPYTWDEFLAYTGNSSVSVWYIDPNGEKVCELPEVVVTAPAPGYGGNTDYNFPYYGGYSDQSYNYTGGSYLPPINIVGGGGDSNQNNDRYNGNSYQDNLPPIYDGNSSNLYTIGPDAFSPFRIEDKTGCLKRCTEMVKAANAEPLPSTNAIPMVNQNNDGTAGTTYANAHDGISAINESLSKGIPVIVGVDYKEGNPGNNDKMTDHFIVIINREIAFDKDGNTVVNYGFYDPATSNKDRGTDPNNKLILDNNRLTGKFGNKNYTVTQVRPNK